MALAPLRAERGYLPLEDHGLIGDGTTAALVGRDGAVVWLCAPRFDAPPVFCRLLDAARGGAFTVAPDVIVASGQRYIDDTGILVTEMQSPTGLLRVTDALTLRSGADLTEDAPAGRAELLRLAEVVEGSVDVRIEIAPYRGAAATEARGGLRLHCPARPELELWLTSSVDLAGMQRTVTLRAGERLHVALRFRCAHRHRRVPPEALLAATAEAWRRWASRIRYEGPERALVRRSAITLKMLDSFESGAVLAAPTSSLPEVIGGTRNWDYRYAWIRDAAFAVHAFRRIGLAAEAWGFLGWALDAIERDGRPKVLYDLDGDVPPPERICAELEGYRGSRPVRWGNAAVDQVQHDVFGEIVDCAYQWASHGGEIRPSLWARLTPLLDGAAREWRRPDHGVWEVRSVGRPFTYSAALCQVALDRAWRLAERHGLPGDVAGLRQEAEEIRRAILEEAWDPRAGALTAALGGGPLDASVLALPLRRVVPADHPRMIATTEAIARGLRAGDGLLYRYLPGDYDDGVATSDEGAFLLCSFWLVDNLTGQGRIDEALALYGQLCARASPLGLLPEQIDPATGAFVGNFPQAFSHVGLIASGVALSRALGRRAERGGGEQRAAGEGAAGAR
ncbi:glycoside hydrolase family 15 protein [Sorangium sp. So ce1036]|uniref:glycoside hydrolase family 15 protein n=1 Tax=Sorangium sp. So ce1036 TaxID=3133328 RepID=UPI003F127716